MISGERVATNMGFNQLLSAVFDGKSPVANVGVEISSYSIKIVELKKSATGFTVASCGQELLPWGVVKSGSVTDVDAVSHALSVLLKRCGIRAKGVATAVAESMVTLKEIMVPRSIAKRDISVFLAGEMARNVGVDEEDLAVDFHLLRSGDAEDAYRVFGTRKEVVEGLTMAIDATGLNTMVADIDHFALFSAVRRLAVNYGIHNKLLAAIDCGASRTQLSFYQGEQLLFSKDLAIGGHTLTQSIQDAFDLGHRDADLGKKQGGLPGAFENTVLPQSIEHFLSVVGRGFENFYSATSHSGVDAVLLFGGQAQLKGLASAVRQHFKTDVFVADVFAGMNIDSKIPKATLRESSSFMTAVGLVLRGHE